MKPSGLPNLFGNLERSLQPVRLLYPMCLHPRPYACSPIHFFLADDEDAGVSKDLSGQIWQHFHIYLEPHDIN